MYVYIYTYIGQHFLDNSGYLPRTRSNVMYKQGMFIRKTGLSIKKSCSCKNLRMDRFVEGQSECFAPKTLVDGRKKKKHTHKIYQDKMHV